MGYTFSSEFETGYTNTSIDKLPEVLRIFTSPKFCIILTYSLPILLLEGDANILPRFNLSRYNILGTIPHLFESHS